jgi:hypothetical protein
MKVWLFTLSSFLVSLLVTVALPQAARTSALNNAQAHNELFSRLFILTANGNSVEPRQVYLLVADTPLKS